MSVESPRKEQGQLSIHAENILPIIKKWLYSDKEIFLRELISNGFDAITKLKHVALTESIPELGDYHIDVRLDRDNKTLTVADNGLGMTAEEIRTYINQVAFSGASEFVKRYELNDANQIIGHFGLGFYSSFMVADKVEIRSRSYKADEPASHWECDGGLEFSLEPTEKAERGTEIILHLAEEDHDFLEEIRIREMIRKYCNYLPIEIRLNGIALNEQSPLWTKTPNSLKDEDYLEFFRKAYPFEEDPLFWIHLNVDYPFRLQGILYFPKLKHEMDVSKGQIQLYCNQVFVSDNSQELIPRFLTVLKGMIDCPDIPLNVSRSMLQNDPYVRKISAHITKKIGERLSQTFKNQREQFERYWDDIHPFVKFGMMEDDKFYDVCKDLVLYETTHGGHTTVAEYLERNKDKHEGKVFYAEAGDTQATYLELFKSQGMEALLTRSILDSHFIHFLESKQPEVKWSRVDSAVGDHLVEKSDKAKLVDAEGKTQDDKLKALFDSAIAAEDLEIQVEGLKTSEISGLITQGEHERRLKEMSALWQRDFKLPDRKTLLINSNNPLIQRLLTLSDPSEIKELSAHVYDLARLAHEGLKGEDMAKFIARSHRLLSK